MRVARAPEQDFLRKLENRPTHQGPVWLRVSSRRGTEKNPFERGISRHKLSVNRKGHSKAASLRLNKDIVNA